MPNYIKVDASIEGVDQLIAQLQKAGANVKKSEMGAIRAGGNVIKAAAKANARRLTTRGGKVVQLRVRKRPTFIVGSITPAKGFGFLQIREYGSGPGKRWSINGKPFTFFSFTANRVIRTRMIEHPGTAATPWLRPAFDQNSDRAAEAVAQALRDAIEKAKIAPEGQDG